MTKNHILDLFRQSGLLPGESGITSEADRILPHASNRWVRAITIKAPPSTVYRWLCQLTLAPYSYDFIDFPGRKSPERLLPESETIAIGDHFLIFRLTQFHVNRYIAGISREEFRSLYGTIAVSYTIEEIDGNHTRLRANAAIGDDIGSIRRTMLAAGDRIMAARQLRRLRKMAERNIGGNHSHEQ